MGLFRRDDVKFAIKVGIGAALYALPSYMASTRPFYQRWRGEWGLLSYILVCTMTLGASNTTGWVSSSPLNFPTFLYNSETSYVIRNVISMSLTSILSCSLTTNLAKNAC